jgi:Raf kinase inhibitor-like YbhB/YbcL family protein
MMEIGSPAFDNGKRLPKAYVRGGDNQSPPLHWWGAPAGARSFMIVCEDLDAPNGGFHHWGYFNIPRTYGDLPEGAGRIGQPTGHQAINGYGEPRYDGPEPPIGKGPHRYVFRLLALDTPSLTETHSMSVGEACLAAERHILATAEIFGVHER